MITIALFITVSICSRNALSCLVSEKFDLPIIQLFHKINRYKQPKSSYQNAVYHFDG